MAAAVEFNSVTKRYGGVIAVDAVSFNVDAGSLVTLLGPSGCGKTTTLRLVAGLELPSEGTIRIGGRDVSRLPASARNVSMVFQSYALFPHMNVLENAAYGPRVAGKGRDEAHAMARAKLDLLGLRDLESRLPSELSGGQQQRVAVARALVLERAATQAPSGKARVRVVNVSNDGRYAVVIGSGSPRGDSANTRPFGAQLPGELSPTVDLPAGDYPLLLSDDASGRFVESGVQNLGEGVWTIFVVSTNGVASLRVLREDGNAGGGLQPLGSIGRSAVLFSMIPDGNASMFSFAEAGHLHGIVVPAGT